MRISQISVSTNYSSQKKMLNQKKVVGTLEKQNSSVDFRGKHTCAKVLAGTCGTLGTLGAIGGTVIMTGGVALPFVLAYGAICAASGAILGYTIENSGDKD